jgi:uncharacterized protein
VHDIKGEIRMGSKKNAINEAKHGISLSAAEALWAGPLVSIPSKMPGEVRHLAIGVIGDNYWTVVYAPHDDHLRLISARHSRENEKALHKNHFPES